MYFLILVISSLHEWKCRLLSNCYTSTKYSSLRSICSIMPFISLINFIFMLTFLFQVTILFKLRIQELGVTPVVSQSLVSFYFVCVYLSISLFISLSFLGAIFLSISLSFYESIFVSISLFLSISTIRFNVKYEYKYGTPSIGTTKCPKNCFLSFQVFRFISKLGSLITSWRGTNFQRFTKFMERNFWRCHSQQVWTERTFLPK